MYRHMDIFLFGILNLGILNLGSILQALRRRAALGRRMALRRRLINVLYYLNTVLTISQLRSRRR